ncbi:hypothetical protein FJP15_RS08475, partial [Escherichia coli]|nr:hypothetical protein [Escherichia coli]
MATLDEVFWKFGYTSEAAHLLEAELINVLIEHEMKQGEDIPTLKEKFLKFDKLTLGSLSNLLRQKGVADDETLQHV